MPRKQQTRGACAYCGRPMTRSGLARHLGSCDARQQALEAAGAKKGADNRTWVQLQVQDAYGGDYWLQLEMDASATLKDLDRYLRAIWLECCGHMSRFSTGGWGSDDIAMSARAARVFRPGVELTHTYDFGTESVTLIRAMDERDGPGLTRKPIALMGRNDAPTIECMECGESAGSLCMECVIEHDRSGALCERHAAKHPHDNYGEPLPIVNSPRVGMCGYDGPAEPPY
jgi:hypothetical protein